MSSTRYCLYYGIHMQMMLLVAGQALKDSASKNENYATSSLISTKKQTKKSKLLIKHDIFPLLFVSYLLILITASEVCGRIFDRSAFMQFFALCLV